MCIVVDICDTLPPLNRLKYYQNVVCVLLSTYVTQGRVFFFPPAGPQTKGLVKSLDFPTQLPNFGSEFPETLLDENFEKFPRHRASKSTKNLFKQIGKGSHPFFARVRAFSSFLIPILFEKRSRLVGDSLALALPTTLTSSNTIIDMDVGCRSVRLWESKE